MASSSTTSFTALARRAEMKLSWGRAILSSFGGEGCRGASDDSTRAEPSKPPGCRSR